MSSEYARIVDDPTDPYYLHHGDSSSSVLVSQPLIGENYNAWRRSMIIALGVKNKLGFIDGSVSKPPSTDAKYALWIRCDTMVLSWMINSLSKDIANSVLYIDSAKKLWDELKERFSESNGPRIFQLQRAISSLAQGQMSVSLYFTKLNEYWGELMNFKPQPVCKCNPACSCGLIKALMDFQHQEQIMQFLNGLNEVFAQTREQILLMEPLPTLNKVYAMVLAQEREKRISLAAIDVDVEATALLSKSYSGKQGYQLRDKPISSHCGMTGHVIDKGYKLHGYPPGYKSNQPRQNSGMANQVSGMDLEMSSVTDDSSAMSQLPFTKEQCEQLIQLLKIHGGQQTTHQANVISAVPHWSDSLMSASDSRRMAAGLNGYSFVPDRTTYGTREEFVSRHVPDRLGAPAAYDYSSSLERDARGQTPTQYPGGILLGPSMGPQGGMDSNSPDADRWLRSCNSQQKGLIPSPQTPLLMMHKAEKKYEVGKVSDEEELKQRLLKAILNKLTPHNFEKLFEQAKAVNIDNAVTLTGVISQIFDKALMEPTFCEMYADFCSHLAVELPDFNEDNEKITFKRVLLNKCQEEFERGEREQEEANKAEEEGEVKQSAEEREGKRIKARSRTLGNIRLIGELYKKKMLTERIMHACIQKLLCHYQNPDVEALCTLMSTVGEMIDHPKAKEHMDAYFEVMKRLSTNMNLSSRVRFMLKDAIDLRKNKWQQRRKVEGPKD